MALSYDLLSQFAKLVNNGEKKSAESTVYGRVVVDDNGYKYVKIDGSEILTPITDTSVDVKDEERVSVLLKDHTMTVTGNVSHPAGRHGDVVEVQEAGILIAQRVEATEANFDKLNANKASFDDLTAATGRIEELVSTKATIKDLEAAEGRIDILESTQIKVEDLDAKYANIDDLEAVTADVRQLEAGKADVGDLTAAIADITDLEANKLSATDAQIKYANIDFANIGEAALRKLFSDYGLIRDLTVSSGTITGELVGVTIKGDLIEGNTVKADKLVVKGSDGLYYKLNVEAGAVASAEVAEEDLQNGLHGTAIIANTITAEKISVDDLVAFDATIGGFHITNNSIYSGEKESATSSTIGMYMGNDGQIAFGDSTNFFRYYKAEDGNYRLEISTGGRTIDEKIDDYETKIQQLVDSIRMLVRDANGESVMTQTADGWFFSTASMENRVNAASLLLDELVASTGSTERAIAMLSKSVDEFGVIAEFVHAGSCSYYDDSGLPVTEPCIDLFETDTGFRLRITNTRIMFSDGATDLVTIDSKTGSLVTPKAIVENELQLGGNDRTDGVWIWTHRANGNLGLMWKTKTITDELTVAYDENGNVALNASSLTATDDKNGNITLNYSAIAVADNGNGNITLS